MSHKRALKKEIRIIAGELLAECVAMINSGEKDPHDGEALLFCIVKFQDDFLARVSHVEPGMSAKDYYKTLREDCANQACSLSDQILNF